jgi:hypothetical protein
MVRVEKMLHEDRKAVELDEEKPIDAEAHPADKNDEERETGKGGSPPVQPVISIPPGWPGWTSSLPSEAHTESLIMTHHARKIPVLRETKYAATC